MTPSEKRNAYNRMYRMKRRLAGNPMKNYNAVWHKAYREQAKLNALIAYGGPICKCCGETTLQFLTLDHVNNDGNKHRRTNGRAYPSYSNLKTLGFPQDPPLQVLCYNCNNGKRVNGGVCPHFSKPTDTSI